MKNAVTEVSFMPGRGDGLIFIRTLESEQSQALFLNDAETKITVDGVTHSYAELIIRLFNSKLAVTLHPRMERYGASTQAEFTTVRD